MRNWIIPVLVLVTCTTALAANDAPPASAKKLTFVQSTQDRVKATLDTLQSSQDWAAAERDLHAINDQAILWAADDRPDALRESDFALRMVKQLRHLNDGEKRAE